MTAQTVLAWQLEWLGHLVKMTEHSMLQKLLMVGCPSHAHVREEVERHYQGGPLVLTEA